MNLIDELIEIGQGEVRSLDSIIAIPKNDKWSLDFLIDGAKFAQSVYPKSSKFPVKFFSDITFDDFINNKLQDPFEIHQAIIILHSKLYLAIKMSHKLCDGLSMLLWLRAQLFRENVSDQMELRSFPAKKDTPYRHFFTTKTWPRNMSEISSRRNFVTEVFSTSSQRMNDKLILSLLRTLGENSSLWLPVNVRKNPKIGFGNALSRMRIYHPGSKVDLEALNEIAFQKKQNLLNGEVFLPPEKMKVPTGIKKQLFKLWLNRPWADWCSLSFSHMTKSGLKDVIALPPISPHHQAVIFAVSEENETYITLTFDEKTVSEHEAINLLKTWKEKFYEIKI